MRQLFKNFLIWLGLFLIGFVIYSTSQGRIYALKDPKKALNWYPSYSETLLNLNDRLLSKGLKEENISQIKKQSIQALNKAPLSFRPFLHLGEASVARNINSNSKILFEETIRRNVRNRRGLRALVTLDVQAQNYSEAIGKLDTLLSLKGQEVALEDYHNTLLSLSDIEGVQKVINDYLRNRPVWARKYLLNRISGITESNFLDIGNSIQSFSRGTAQNANDDVIHKYYLRSLYRLRKIDEAYFYWVDLSEGSLSSKNYEVFNPNFEQRSELPPFNWLEVSMPKYFSEIDHDNGLYASFADNKVRVLTEQLLKLNSGESYRLKLNADWTYKQRQGMFFWTITCITSQAIIAGVNLDDDAKKESGGVMDFRIPLSGCEQQSVRLIATPGQYSQRIWSRTDLLDIIKIEQN